MVLRCQLVPLPVGVQVEMFAFLALAMLLLYLVAAEILMPPWRCSPRSKVSVSSAALAELCELFFDFLFHITFYKDTVYMALCIYAKLSIKWVLNVMYLFVCVWVHVSKACM